MKGALLFIGVLVCVYSHSAWAAVGPLETIIEEWEVGLIVNYLLAYNKDIHNNFRLGSWNSERITLETLERRSTV